MEVKVGDTLDLIGYKGTRTPVQVVNITDDAISFKYLDNSGRPNGTCQENELEERDQTVKSEDSAPEETQPEEESAGEPEPRTGPEVAETTETTESTTDDSDTAKVDGGTDDSENSA